MFLVMILFPPITNNEYLRYVNGVISGRSREFILYYRIPHPAPVPAGQERG